MSSCLAFTANNSHNVQLLSVFVLKTGALTALPAHVEGWRSAAGRRALSLPRSSLPRSEWWLTSWWGKDGPLDPARLPSQKAAPPPQTPVAAAAGFVPAVLQNTSN